MARSVFTPSGISKEGAQTVKRFKSRSTVEIHTPNGVYGPRNRSMDPSHSLIQWSYSKQLSSSNSSSDIGTLTLQLTAGIPGKRQTDTWMNYVTPMNLIVISVSPDGLSKMRTRFVGYVTSINQYIDTTNAQNPTRYVEIQASDLMMGLDTEILFPSYKPQFINSLGYIPSETAMNLFLTLQKTYNYFGNISNSNSISLWSLWASLFTNIPSTNKLGLMTPSSMANLIIDKILGVMFTPIVKVSNSKTAMDATFLDLIEERFDDTSQFTGAEYFAQPSDGTYYSMITSVMNAPYLEFFGDCRSADEINDLPGIYTGTHAGISFGTDNATFCVVARNVPFDTSSGCPGTSPNPYKSLGTVDIYLKDTTNQQWGPDLTDVVNFYYVIPEGYLQQGSTLIPVANTLYGAKIDVESMLQYGMSPLQVTILGYPQSNGDPYNPQDIELFQEALWDWYHKNPTYIKGSFSCHGNPLLRVGKRVKLHNADGHKWLMGYIESVQETFVAMQSYSASVTFSRGEYDIP